MEKEKEIITEILKIPLEQWNGYESEIKGLKVTFNPTHSNLAKFFEINGVEFYDERVDNFIYNLEKFRKNECEKKINNTIDEIHNLLCFER